MTSRAALASLAVAFAAPSLPLALDDRSTKPALRILSASTSTKILMALRRRPWKRSIRADKSPDVIRWPSICEFTDALAKKYNMSRENIALGCGSTEILRCVDMAFLGPGKNIVAAEPTFEAVLEYARITRAEAVKIPLTADHRHDLPKMAAACTSKTGVVYVCNPNNPTATIVTREELAPLFTPFRPRR